MERVAEKSAGAAEKDRLRALARKRLAELAAREDLRARSGEIRARLARWRSYRAARVIGAFRARPDEPDLEPLLRRAATRGVRVCVPAWDGRRYRWALWTPKLPERRGRYGLFEPARPRWVSPARVELCLVPGLAFDLGGRRLGRGGGHFDRLLKSTAGKRVGVAFSEQIIERVPAGPRDVNMDAIVTDRGLLALKGDGHE